MARDKTDPAPDATLAVNEWGLPDWRDPTSYGNVKNRKLVRWRWEFVRREPKYRSAALEFFSIVEARAVAAQAVRHMETPEARKRHSDLADMQAKAYTTLWKKWAYCEVLDPRISEYPDDKLKVLYYDRFNILDGSPSSEAGQSSTSPRIGQTAVTFDLDRPLQPQIDSALRELQKRQKSRHGNLIQRRLHPKLWLGYLRTLDARATGLSWPKMAEAFFVDGLLGRHKDPKGGYCAPPPQAARDKWDAAKALRINF